MERRWARWRVWIVFILVVVVTALIVIPRADGAGLYQKAVGLGPGYGLGLVNPDVITIAYNRLAEGIDEKQAMTLTRDPIPMRSMT